MSTSRLRAVSTAPAVTLPTVEEIDSVSFAELSALAVELAALQVHVASRLRRAPTIEPETLLTAGEVASILRTSADWVRHQPDLPFRVKAGGQVLYSPAGLARWQKAHEGDR